MDTEFTSGDFCGVTDVPFSTSNNSIKTTESGPTYPLDRGLKPVKEIKRDGKVEDKPKYSKWCLGMSWFGLCKSKTASKSNVSVRIQFGDISDTTTTSTTSSTTSPSTTLQSTAEYETVWTQRSIALSTENHIEPSSTIKLNPNKGNHKVNSKWCLGMSWFGLCASKTVFQPIQNSTITSSTTITTTRTTTSTATSTTTSTATTTTTQTYSDDYYNYY